MTPSTPQQSSSVLDQRTREVDFRRIWAEARNKKGRAIFESFSSEGPSEFSVVSRAPWDEYQRRLNAQKRRK